MMADEPEVSTAEVYLGGPQPLRPADFKYVRYAIEGAVARLTLNRADSNILDERMLQEIAAGIDSLRDKDDVKLIILDSSQKVFSQGVDLREYTPQRVFQMIDAFHQVFTHMVDLGRPVLVVVNGPAIGGGAELVAFGDLVVATPKAYFAQPEITIGVFPPLASTMLPLLIGPKVALELVLMGNKLTAERARDLGLVNWLVAEDQLDSTVQKLAAQITTHSGAVLSMAKRAILEGLGMTLRDGMRHSMNIFLNELYRLEDSQEGLRAQIEKRKPQWKNR
jgi:cyclohexa-1,5-dienecarbonyl-CoA hydratase